jgi:hypothetical protein
MTTNVAADIPSLTAEEALARVDTIDLSMIRMKLADPHEGKGWSDKELDVAEREYRCFLALHLMYPEMAVVPCGLVDVVWHAHILDTQAYAPDCERVFGFFLHHFPYFGMRGEQDATDLMDAYDLTVARYTDAFGTPAEGVWRPEQSASCKRTNCKPQRCR